MKAIEFKSKIKNNQISIPSKIQTELKDDDKDVRVIVLVDESNINEEILFKKNTQKQFLEGYADTDSIYDTY